MEVSTKRWICSDICRRCSDPCRFAGYVGEDEEEMEERYTDSSCDYRDDRDVYANTGCGRQNSCDCGACANMDCGCRNRSGSCMNTGCGCRCRRSACGNTGCGCWNGCGARANTGCGCQNGCGCF